MPIEINQDKSIDNNTMVKECLFGTTVLHICCRHSSSVEDSPFSSSDPLLSIYNLMNFYRY